MPQGGGAAGGLTAEIVGLAAVTTRVVGDREEAVA